MGWRIPVVVAGEVIIVGPAGELLVYNPTIAFGDLIASIEGQAGFDTKGNTTLQGIASYGSGTAGFRQASVLDGGLVAFYYAPSAGGVYLSVGYEGIYPTVGLGGPYYLAQITESGILQGAESAGGIGILTMVPSGDASGAADIANLNNALQRFGNAHLIPGTYYTDATIAPVDSNTMLTGQGIESSEINVLGTGYHGFTTTDLLNQIIKDLTFTGPAFAAGTNDGIHIDSTTVNPYGTQIEDVRVQNFGHYGIYLNAAIVSSIRNTEVSHVAQDGFFILDGTSVHLDTCYSHGQSGTGYVISGVQYGSLVNCACDFGQLGYEIQNCNNIHLAGCGSEGQAGTGVVGGYKIDSGSVGVVMDACLCRGNANIACWITGDSTATLTGFQEIAPAAGAVASIQVDAGSTATIIDPVYVTPPVYNGTVTETMDGMVSVWAGGVLLSRSIPPSGDATGATDSANFAAAYALGCKTVTLEAGAYFVNAPITVPTGCALIGAFPTQADNFSNYSAGVIQAQGTVITPVGAFTSAAVIQCTNSTPGVQQGGQVIANLSIQANTTTAGSGSMCILLNGAVGAGYISGVTAIRGDACCLRIRADATTAHIPDQWTIENVTLAGSRSGPGLLADDMADFNMINVYSHDNALDGFDVTGGGNSKWTGCRAETNATGNGFHHRGFPTAGQMLTLDGFTTELNGKSGFLFDSTKLANAGQYAVIGCSSRSDGQTAAGILAGFYDDGARAAVVLTGCTTLTNGTGPAYGAYIGSVAFGLSLAGCRMQGITAATHDDLTNTNPINVAAPVPF